MGLARQFIFEATYIPTCIRKTLSFSILQQLVSLEVIEIPPFSRGDV